MTCQVGWRKIKLRRNEHVNVKRAIHFLNWLKLNDNELESKSQKLLSRIYQKLRAINFCYLFYSFAVLCYRLIPLFIKCIKRACLIIKWGETFCVKSACFLVTLFQLNGLVMLPWRLIDFSGILHCLETSSRKQFRTFVSRLTNSLSLIKFKFNVSLTFFEMFRSLNPMINFSLLV